MKLEGTFPVRGSEEPNSAATSGSSEPIRLLVPDLPVADDLLASLRRIDAARWYTNGGVLCAEFEAALEALLGPTSATRQHVVTTSSGTSALEVALSCLDLPRGARVLVPAYTFPATANAVVRAGHVPVLSDVCAQCWALTPALAHRALERERVDAVVPVSVFGTSLPVPEWDQFVESTDVPVLIDAAAALGTLGGGRRVVVAFSLHATKPLGIGEGGLVATADSAFAARVRRIINHGFESGRVAVAGTNARLNEYAAAVGLAQLARCDRVRERRRMVWDRYVARLSNVPGVVMQQGARDETAAVLSVMTDVAADVVAAAFARHRIETRRWYAPPLHGHAAYADAPRAGGNAAMPVAERLGSHAIGLPFHTRLSAADVDRVVDTLAAALRALSRERIDRPPGAFSRSVSPE